MNTPWNFLVIIGDLSILSKGDVCYACYNLRDTRFCILFKLYARYFHICCNMLKQRSIIFLLFCVFFEYGTGLYFHIGETERKCFIEEIPDETKVLGKLLL